MRLSAADYRHPAELPTLAASAWLSATLLLAVEAALVWLVIARPLNPWVSGTVAAILLVLLNVGAAIAILRVPQHRAALRGAGRRVGPSTHGRVHRAVEDVAERLALPGTPPVHVLPTDEMDSFTIAWGRPDVFVTAGLVESQDDLSLRAALAHELAHLKGHHAALMTALWLPLRARLAHPLLLIGLWLAWLPLRWWLSVVELSADRAAAIAVRGAEPVARWLTDESSEPGDPGLDLHHYLGGTLGAEDWRYARSELHLAYPEVGARIAQMGRFVNSRRFAACLALVGDLQIEPPRAADPASPGIFAWVVIGALAGVWLTPLTVAVTVALGEPSVSAPRVGASVATPVGEFDPDAVPEPRATADEPTRSGARNPFEPPETSAAGQAADESADDEPADDEPATDGPPSDQAAGDQASEDDMPASVSSPEEMLELGRRYKERGELVKARRVLEDLMLSDPTMAEAHYLLAWVHAARDDTELAIAEFTATVNLTEPDSQMHREAAAALERLKD